MKKEKYIYFDHAATTKVCKEAMDAMQPYFSGYYANPSSAYQFGMISANAMVLTRKTISGILGCSAEEIFFTSGGTESDNWALTGLALENHAKGKHLITSKIEHPAILNTCRYLESCGFEITMLSPDRGGRISLVELEKAIRKDTILISVMTANNETGTIQPIREIGRIAKKHDILFHTDAVQAFCHIPVDVSACQIDLLSASSHKFGGPKGVGFLYIRKGVKLHSFMHGGHQEKGLRAGTGNVAGVVGMGAAAGKYYANLENNMQYEKMLRNYGLRRLLQEIPGCTLNGDLQGRLPGNLNVRIPGVDGAALMGMLDMKKICISTGSACSSGESGASHVLRAIGLSEEEAYQSVRITLSYENTREEMDALIAEIKKVTKELRK